MRRAALAALILYSGISTAADPLTFKGHAIGDPKSAVLPKFAVRCNGDHCFNFPARTCVGGPDTECFKSLSYGGVLPTWLSLQFSDERLVLVQLTLPVYEFESFAAALMERFGKPAFDERSTVKTMAGAELAQRKLAWEQGDALLTFSQRGSRIDESSLTFASKSYLAVRKDKTTAERAKNL